MSDLRLSVSKTIKAPIDKVFDAWLNPETLSQFMLPMPGMPNPKTECDPKEGGKFAIYMQVGEEVVPHTGEYLLIQRPDKLVFSWKSPCSVDGSEVTINLNAVSSVITDVELVHIKFIDEATRSDHEGGWGNILEKLNEIIK